MDLRLWTDLQSLSKINLDKVSLKILHSTQIIPTSFKRGKVQLAKYLVSGGVVEGYYGETQLHPHYPDAF